MILAPHTNVQKRARKVSPRRKITPSVACFCRAQRAFGWIVRGRFHAALPMAGEIAQGRPEGALRRARGHGGHRTHGSHLARTSARNRGVVKVGLQVVLHRIGGRGGRVVGGALRASCDERSIDGRGAACVSRGSLSTVERQHAGLGVDDRLQTPCSQGKEAE